MAKAVLGPAVTDVRGQLGGLVFSKGATGAILRTNKKPKTSATTAQYHLRGSLAAFANRWDNVLTETYRQDWRNFTLLHTRTDQLLKTYTLTGFAMFVSVNQALKQVGLAAMDDAPLSYSVGTPAPLTVTWTSPSGPLKVDSPGSEPGTHDVPAIWAAQMLPPGRIKNANKLRFLQSFTANTSGPWDITTAYTNKFGAFILGKGITLMVQYTSDQSGAQSTTQTAYQLL